MLPIGWASVQHGLGTALQAVAVRKGLLCTKACHAVGMHWAMAGAVIMVLLFTVHKIYVSSMRVHRSHLKMILRVACAKASATVHCAGASFGHPALLNPYRASSYARVSFRA